MNTRLDGQKARSIATQTAIMEAAEKLVAKKGIPNVSIKEIVKEAGQKNESALQYHFKNLKGLIGAIHEVRSKQVRAKRAELLDELQASDKQPSLRDICHLMIMPTFLLAKSDVKFRRYVASFSHEVALTQESALQLISRGGGGGDSGHRTSELIRAALPHLDEAALQQRMELALRFCAVSMGFQSKQKNAFRGREADIFFSSLIDALEGLLAAPVSEETKSNLNS